MSQRAEQHELRDTYKNKRHRAQKKAAQLVGGAFSKRMLIKSQNGWCKHCWSAAVLMMLKQLLRWQPSAQLAGLKQG